MLVSVFFVHCFIAICINPPVKAQPLATGFPLIDGAVNITVPGDAATRDDYIVVRTYTSPFGPMRHALIFILNTVFGDSGNASPKFTIKNPAPDVTSLFN